jgi:tellurite resistance protein
MQVDAPLKHLAPGWFASVMGWAGIALAWHRAGPAFGELAAGVSLIASAVAGLVFVALAAATLWRWRSHPQALLEDTRHPVRHAFFATIPVGALLIATLLVAHFGPALPGVATLWALAALAQLGVTIWVLSRWLRATPAAGTAGWQWAGITPALFIPIVGNVIAPLAGVPLGQAAWSAAQFGIGLLFWPVVLVLVVLRIAQAGMLPDRLLPTLFIVVAPPAVVGSAVLQFGAPPLIAWMAWGMALACLAWVATLARRLAEVPFGLPHWAMSFPLAAFAALTLRLAELPEGRWLSVPAIALLAFASLVVLALTLATLRGLRAGTLLVPEAAPVIPVQARA